MSTQRVFTISEVNALIPSLSSLVGDQLREQADIEHGLAELTRLSGSAPSLEATEHDRDNVSRLKHELRKRITRYEAGWDHIQSLGGVIKDPRIGLVDFYGRVGGKLVWLCWRYGEDKLGYYHDLDVGYPGRRALGAEQRALLLN